MEGKCDIRLSLGGKMLRTEAIGMRNSLKDLN